MLEEFTRNMEPGMAELVSEYEDRLKDFYRGLLGSDLVRIGMGLASVDEESFNPIGPETMTGVRASGFGIEHDIEPRRFGYDHFKGFHTDEEADITISPSAIEIKPAPVQIKLKTAPVFVVGEENLGVSTERRPKLPKYADSFIHVLSKFACYSIQDIPVINALILTMDYMKSVHGVDGNMIDIMKRVIERDEEFGDVLKVLYGLSEGTAYRLEKMFWNQQGYSDGDCLDNTRSRSLNDLRLSEKFISDSDFPDFLINWHDRYDSSSLYFMRNGSFVRKYLETLGNSVDVTKVPTGVLRASR
ncbi:MAG: hypothetical protein ABIJ92_00835 [Candidatus Aenigmatarchaeota archaeon]